MKKLLFGLILASTIVSCKSEQEKLIETLDCKSVEDCLSTYDFKSARSIAALSEGNFLNSSA